MGVLGALLESENQVSGIGRPTCLGLQNVAFRVMKSDFTHDQ